MKIHHLNCATMCPPFKRWIEGSGSNLSRGTMICHCLLIENDEGLLLVDSWIGMKAITQPWKYIGYATQYAISPRLAPHETAIAQVDALGFRPEDVRHIVLTHLDVDHAGGLPDFPWAQVHVFQKELSAATMPRYPVEYVRYHKAQWEHDVKWLPYEVTGEPWFGFRAVRTLKGLPPEILMIPLEGHTQGHCGIAVNTSESGWILHAGDAYFYHGEVHGKVRSCPPMLDLFQTIFQIDAAARRNNQDRLRDLVHQHGKDIQVFCAHDPKEL